MKFYTDHAERVGGRRRSTVTPTGSSKEELANIRSWATSNGYQVSQRGRISREIRDAYHAANA